MRAVNLLPPQLVEQRRSPIRDPRVAIGLAVALVVLGGLAYARHTASSTVASRRQQLADVRAQIALASRPRVPSPATPAKTPLDGRSALIVDAASKRANWDRLFRELALVLPNDVWLADLKAQTTSDGSASSDPAATTADSGSTGFSIEGSTYSQAAVARLLSRLQLIPDLTNVHLEQSETSTASSTGSSAPAPRTVQFTISATVVPVQGGA
jgi:Tfp pilus assembly protein PilN